MIVSYFLQELNVFAPKKEMANTIMLLTLFCGRVSPFSVIAQLYYETRKTLIRV